MKIKEGQSYSVHSGWRTWSHPESNQISGGADGIPFELQLLELADDKEDNE